MKSLKLIVDDSSKNRRVKTEEWSIATGKTTKGNQLLVSPKSKSNTPQIWNLESYEQQIEAIEGNLQLCQSLTDDMLRILDSFENRLVDLEDSVLPLHKQTSSLTKAQKNIESTLEHVERVKMYTEVSKLPAESFTIENLRDNFSNFLDNLEKINSALSFFEENNSFQNSHKTIKLLSSLQKKAFQVCQSEFEREMNDLFSSVDVEKLLDPLASDFKLIPDAIMNSLGRLVAAMDHCGNRSFLEVYSSKRSSSFASTINEQFHILEESLEQKNESANVDPRFKIKLKTRKKVKVEKYVKGSHGFITYSQLLLKLLRMERDALANLLDYSGIDENEMDQTFIKLSEEAINTFVKHAEEVWKKKHRSKVLALLDILENCERLVPEFRDLLHSNSDKILDMIEQLRKATNKALEDRIESIYQHSFKDSPSDGGYSSITVQTMTFIKSLYEYRTIVESMFSHSSRINLPGIHTEMKKENIESPTTIGKIFVSILQVLQSNLEQKANSYKNSSLSSIFLINNYHYMIKSIKSSNLVDALGGIIIHHFESLFLEARKAYKDFTWTKLLSHISLDLNKELVTKVASGELNSNTKKAIKAKFDNFNSIFEELCATQKQFSVPDADLKSRLRNENIETIVPIYKAFVHKFGSLEFSKHAAKYIRYREMVLEQMLNKFFEEA